MLRDSSAAVVRKRPRAIPLAMITMRISTHGAPLGGRAAGAPIKMFSKQSSYVWPVDLVA